MRFFLPSSQHVFTRVCNLMPDQAHIVAEHLQLDGPGDRKLRLTVASKLKMSEDAVNEILRYVSAVRDYNRLSDIDKDSLSQELEFLCKEFDIKVNNPKRAEQVFYILLLSGMSDIDKKKERVVRGLGNELNDISSMVDLRPVFDTERESIKSWVIGVTLRFNYYTPTGDEGSLIIELNEKSLAKLKSEVEIIERKHLRISDLATEKALI